MLHGDGPASTWADQAKVGQHLYIGGPRGSMIVPDIFDSYLLIGDETAIPAIARRLEELPAGRTVLAVIEIADAAEQQALHSAAASPSCGSGNSPAKNGSRIRPLPSCRCPGRGLRRQHLDCHYAESDRGESAM